MRTALEAWFKTQTTRTGRPGRPRRAFPPAPAGLQLIVKPLAKSPAKSPVRPAAKPVDPKRMIPRGELMFLVSWICGTCRYRASNVIAAGTDNSAAALQVVHLCHEGISQGTSIAVIVNHRPQVRAGTAVGGSISVCNYLFRRSLSSGRCSGTNEASRVVS